MHHESKVSSPSAPAVEVPAQGLSLRAVLIGVVLAAIACCVVSWAELVIKEIQIAICQFAPAAIGLLLVAVLANRVIRLISRRLSLNSAEIMIVYAMILVAALTTSRGLMEKWLPGLVGVNYYSTPENGWVDVLYPYIPSWLVPFDVRGAEKQEVSRLFYEGLGAGEKIPWRAWLTPILSWLIVIAAIFYLYFSLATILRKQWVDHEKLTFPLTNLPIELAREAAGRGTFFANKLTWIGFALPAFVFTLNGLHGLYPTIPMIPVKYELHPHFRAMGRPWKDIHYTVAFCSMAAVGFSYFLPAQLLFSLWFFFVLSRVQDIVFSAFGATPQAMPLYPCKVPHGYQAAGAYVVLTVYLVKAAIPHLRQVVRKAWTGDPTIDDSKELLSFRAAAGGLVLAFVVAVVWCMYSGMTWWMALIEIGVYVFVVSLIMARSVNEGGLLMTEASFRPVDLVRMFVPLSSVGKSNLASLGFFDAVFTRDLRGCLLSTFLDEMKIAEQVRLNGRALFGAVAVALVVGIGVSGFLALWLPYHIGGVGMYGYVYRSQPLHAFRFHVPAMMATQQFQPALPIYFSIGTLVTIGLSVMRARYWWWPLFPLGYALWGSWTMIVFWFPIFIAWLIKTALVRYGGMKLYATLRPLFLGLILGEFFMAVFWATFSGFTRSPAPFFPWP